MYFIPKYLRYSVGTEEICFSAKQRGARGADMDLAELCGDNQIQITWVPTMEALGSACGIEVGAAAAAVLL